jgi:hypothetical protein
MKKFTLTLFTLITVFVNSKAQNFQLLDTTGASGGSGSVAQTTYNFNVDTSASGSFMFNVHNPTSSSVTIKVKKYLIFNAGGDVTSFCIGTNCYGSSTTLSGAVSIPANSNLGSGFLTDFVASNTNNTARVVYTIFDTTTPSDSITTIINYNVSSSITGIKQITSTYNVSNIAPNPANNSISLAYDLKNTNQPASVKIYNMLGTLVKTSSLETYSNATKIDIASFEEGMYFYSVTIGSKVIKTGRLVVAR